MATLTPIEVLEEKYNEYCRALQKSKECFFKKVITKETHHIHVNNLEPLIKMFNDAIQKLKS